MTARQRSSMRSRAPRGRDGSATGRSSSWRWTRSFGFARANGTAMQSDKLTREAEMRIARNRINKLTLLRERLGDPEWRRYGYLLLAGKLFGIALVLGAIVFFSSAIGTDVHADEAVPVLQGNDIVNPINTMWTLASAFADTCSTITSGAMIGRTGFVGDLIYSLGVSGFIYPIIGHWAWGPDGFLATMGSEGNFLPGLGTSFHDFAGSTVVHTIGGFV